AVFPLAGALGVVALTRGRVVGRTRTAAVVAAWSGSAAAFSGGLWTAVTTLGTTDLAAAGNPAGGLAMLCWLLAGFALAVAGLLAVSGTRVGSLDATGRGDRLAPRCGSRAISATGAAPNREPAGRGGAPAA
ncbi:MAG: hypothetical protein M3235_21835, partial [Actinomycetota bacterium]|nr:hypothetical protein [Actinomycetota bacterium]